MSAVLVFAVAGAGTYVLRSSMVLLGERLPSPVWLDQRLALVGSAVLACLVVAGLFGSAGPASWPGTVEAVAVGGAFVTVRRTGNAAHALLVGLPILWAASLLGLG